jgi:hypothetical protein
MRQDGANARRARLEAVVAQQGVQPDDATCQALQARGVKADGLRRPGGSLSWGRLDGGSRQESGDGDGRGQAAEKLSQWNPP